MQSSKSTGLNRSFLVAQRNSRCDFECYMDIEVRRVQSSWKHLEGNGRRRKADLSYLSLVLSGPLLHQSAKVHLITETHVPFTLMLITDFRQIARVTGEPILQINCFMQFFLPALQSAQLHGRPVSLQHCRIALRIQKVDCRQINLFFYLFVFLM